MSAPIESRSIPITGKRQLIEYLEAGCKPPAAWRIGTEHEKFTYRLDDLKPLPYEGPVGIRAILEGLERMGWTPVREAGAVIALGKEDGSSVTLEPGGQIELSGAPLATIHETCDEVYRHLAELDAINEELGVGLIGLGFQPKWRRQDIPWMPKGRYAIMRKYMQKKGKMGLDMMLRTCTVQVNLDFASEADMVRKFRVALALQPVATALFANSPFTEGKPNGFLSYRSHVWMDTDPDRTGVLPFVFAEDMGFERYVDHVLDTPMYFVYRDGKYIDVSGRSFRDFIDGRLAGLDGEAATLGDWEDHLTTLFPEVRMKRFLEMRGADGGPWRSICALPALWVGLLYDQTSLDAAWDLVRDWSAEDRALLRREVPRQALATNFKKRTVRELAREVLDIARYGLAARARPNTSGEDETQFLETLSEVVSSGRTPAQIMLEEFETRWRGDIDKVFEYYAY